MLDEDIIQFVCCRAEQYWRSMLEREEEYAFFKSKLKGNASDCMHVAACTIDAVHTFLPLQSEFQRTTRLAPILFGHKMPLWIRNSVGIWHPLTAIVFTRTNNSAAFDEFSVKEVLQLLLNQVMDSVYSLIVRLGTGAINVRVVNLLDYLQCVRLSKQDRVCAVIEAQKLMSNKNECILSPQQKIEFLLKIYKTMVRECVDAELAACGSFSQQCRAFIKGKNRLAVNRSLQNSLFVE